MLAWQTKMLNNYNSYSKENKGKMDAINGNLRNLKKHLNLLEKNHMEILELKDTISEIINVIDGFNSGCTQNCNLEDRQ